MILGRYGISNLGVASLRSRFQVWNGVVITSGGLMRLNGMKKSPPPNEFAVFTKVIYLKRSMGETNTGSTPFASNFWVCFWGHVTGLHGWRNGGRQRVRERGVVGNGNGAILARKLQITNHAEYKSVKLASD